MLKALCLATILILSSLEIVKACGPEWTYIGRAPGITNTWCIHELVDSSGVFLRGGSDEGAGVYRWVGQDTTWERISLAPHDIMKIKEYPNFPHQLFAVATDGLFTSLDNGFTWDLVTNLGAGGPGSYGDFTISPFDSTSWFISVHDPVGETMIVSRDSGVTWQFFNRHQTYYDPMWVMETPGMMYFRGRGNSLYRLQLEDSTVQSILTLGSGYSTISAIKHPLQPWIYILADGDPGRLIRYDVLTEEILTWITPDTILCLSYFSYLQYSDGQGILVGSGDSLCLLSDDLQSLEVVNGSLPNQACKQVLFASENLWITEVYNFGLFCRSPIDQAASDRPCRAATHIEFYPNPARETITFQTANQLTGRVEIYDILGRRVTEWIGANTSGPLTIPLTSLTSGTYFFRLYSSPTDQTPLWHNTFTILK